MEIVWTNYGLTHIQIISEKGFLFDRNRMIGTIFGEITKIR